MKHRFEKTTGHWIPSWDAILKNINACRDAGETVERDPGLVVCFDVLVPEMNRAWDMANWLGQQHNQDFSIHTYVGLYDHSPGVGRHSDVEDVYCLGAVGTTRYTIYEDGQEYTYDLNQNDLLYIPGGTDHIAVPLTTRAVLSYGFK